MDGILSLKKGELQVNNKAKTKPPAVLETITGVYTRTKLHDYESGFTIFTVRTKSEVITCAGRIVVPYINATVQVSGEWTTHEKYGKQLKNCSLVEIIAGYDTVHEYLLHIPGIGEETAHAVASSIDADLREVVKQRNAVEYIASTAKIALNRAEAICEYIKRHEAYTTLFLMLAEFPGGSAAADRIYSKYGENAVNAIVTDPYLVGTKYGLTFAECERIAVSHSAVSTDDTGRVIACTVDMLRGYENDGDCCVDQTKLAVNVRRKINDAKWNQQLKRVKEKKDRLLLKKKQMAELKEYENRGGGISTIIALDNMLQASEFLIRDRGTIYSRPLFWQEARTAAAIKRIIRSGIRTECDPDELCDYAEQVCGVKYAEQQREAFRAFQTGGLYILTGGPGTGKTTVVRGLLTAYEKLFPNNVIRLCAPTGRASQRMKEATNREACTIHRLLEYHPYGDSFSCKNEASPIEANLIVVDESSMISIDLAELLFNAVRPGTMVLLVGDTAQLPSVGPGNVLADIIRSGVVPMTALTKTHRQGAGSPIIENARRINEGQHELVTNIDFAIVECDEESLLKSIRNQYVIYHKDSDPFAVQVLTTTRRDPLKGCNAMSKVIQKQVNMAKIGGIRYGDTTYYVGDKIMMTHNNYNIGYFNGDVGIIKSTSSTEIVVEINGELVHVPNSMLCDMSLAYATTIHKSQGSEYDVVIVVVPPQPSSMLQRNILYTAITRARKRVILVASDNTIFTCVNTVTAVQRKTRLCERLRDMHDNVRFCQVNEVKKLEGGKRQCHETLQVSLSAAR